MPSEKLSFPLAILNSAIKMCRGSRRFVYRYDQGHKVEVGERVEETDETGTESIVSITVDHTN